MAGLGRLSDTARHRPDPAARERPFARDRRFPLRRRRARRRRDRPRGRATEPQRARAAGKGETRAAARALVRREIIAAVSRMRRRHSRDNRANSCYGSSMTPLRLLLGVFLVGTIQAAERASAPRPNILWLVTED